MRCQDFTTFHMCVKEAHFGLVDHRLDLLPLLFAFEFNDVLYEPCHAAALARVPDLLCPPVLECARAKRADYNTRDERSTQDEY